MGIANHEFARLLALLQAGHLAELETASLALTRDHADDGRVWQMLGVARLSAGRDRDAEAPLRRACALMPGNASAWDNLGLACHRLGRHAEAEGCFRRGTDLEPGRLSLWVNWSMSASETGDAQAAETYARRALALDPRQADAWLNLGNALVDQGRPDDAETAYRNALGARPGFSEALLSYALLLEQRGRLAEASQAYGRFIQARPDDWRGHAGLGKVYATLGWNEPAGACYRRAVELDPSAEIARSGLLMSRLYDEAASAMEVFEEHRAYGTLLDAAHAGERPAHGNDRDPERRLRVGFVSGDFLEHAVARFFEPFLAAFDTVRFTALLYATRGVDDAVSRRLRARADVWVDASRMGDATLAARIAADAVDILVDLSGHTAHNRLPVFARKPAPVQVSWLGYPATTGLAGIDYRPVFARAAFPGIEAQFTERLVYLPCAPTFRHPDDAPAVGPLPAARAGVLTFANLNRSHKLGDAVIRTWGRLLAELPTARLLVGAVSEAEVRDDLARRFAAVGVDPERLLFRPRLPMRDYLELHNEIDVLLDPFPFSGLTTSAHAVWMGVPVLTLAGDALVRRQGIVVMESLGLGDWVAADPDAYVRKAVEVAGDLPALAALRAGLRERVRASPLASPDLEARCMEAAFRTMWRRWCAGLSPESFSVPAPDAARDTTR